MEILIKVFIYNSALKIARPFLPFHRIITVNEGNKLTVRPQQVFISECI
jgi:hypothetical protein